MVLPEYKEVSPPLTTVPSAKVTGESNCAIKLPASNLGPQE